MARRSGDHSSTRGPERASNWHFAELAEAARLLGLSEAEVLKRVRAGDLHLNEEDLNTNPVSESGAVGSPVAGTQPASNPVSEAQPASSPVSESRAVTFDDAVRTTGHDAATIERRVRNGGVRVRVPRRPAPPDDGG